MAWHPGVMILLSIGSIFSLLSCSTAKSGEGSVAKDGSTRDPGELLAVGTEAPDFTVKDHLGNQVTLQAYKGKQNVVLIFYPMNETPGCTQQLCTARDDFKRYETANVAVCGVNPATAESHAKFADQYDFPFGILVDSEGEVVRKYGCRGFAGMTKRTVYVIDQEGKIVFAERGMPNTEKQLASINS
ncbi:MAG: peroxiredoxin [Sumerlaeia bacterium]